MQMRQLAVREHVLPYEIAHAATNRPAFDIARRDAVVEEQSAVAHDGCDCRKIQSEVCEPDVLEHPDAGRLVERRSAITRRQFAIVEQFQLHSVCETELTHPIAPVLELVA